MSSVRHRVVCAPVPRAPRAPRPGGLRDDQSVGTSMALCALNCDFVGVEVSGLNP